MSRPNEDLEKVRSKLPTDMRSRGDCPERAGVCWCSQNAAHDALDRVQARIEALETVAEKAKVLLSFDGATKNALATALAALDVSGGRDI